MEIDPTYNNNRKGSRFNPIHSSGKSASAPYFQIGADLADLIVQYLNE